MHPSAHEDTFTRDNLPPENMWPQLLFDLPTLDFPTHFNCVAELIDRHLEKGDGERIAVRTPDFAWSYKVDFPRY